MNVEKYNFKCEKATQELRIDLENSQEKKFLNVLFYKTN